ncbi:MAG: acetyl-CoA carboxylase biotin carboxyl carrier protein subunit [Polyangiaceae bacterium]|nr:acetyl-CoA carboxylase biotin carboxyl carrier protein subunit [Polyangiaceae bacterium]
MSSLREKRTELSLFSAIGGLSCSSGRTSLRELVWRPLGPADLNPFGGNDQASGTVRPTPWARGAWVAGGSPKSSGNVGYGPQVATEVRAQITGTVWKVLVRVGDPVVEEQALAILESMKMEIPVEAPSAGQVQAIHVAEGGVVEEGALLFTLA